VRYFDQHVTIDMQDAADNAESTVVARLVIAALDCAREPGVTREVSTIGTSKMLLAVSSTDKLISTTLNSAGAKCLYSIVFYVASLAELVIPGTISTLLAAKLHVHLLK